MGQQGVVEPGRRLHRQRPAAALAGARGDHRGSFDRRHDAGRRDRLGDGGRAGGRGHLAVVFLAGRPTGAAGITCRPRELANAGPGPAGTAGAGARAAGGRLSPWTPFALVGLPVAAWGVGGGSACFFPAAATALQETGVPAVVPSPSPLATLFSPSPSASPSPVSQQGAFTVLLLGSDDDSKFSADHVLTQSMILVRVLPATKEVVMLSIPRDLYVHLSTGGSGKIDGAYSYGSAGAAIATVEQDFGVRVDDYIWVGLLGLIKVIDAIGGIDVVTSNPVMDDYYPSDIYANSPYHHPPATPPPAPPHP